jgi:predicted Zn-dependent protease
MLKTQLVILVLAITLIIGLYFLPKVVVDDKKKELNAQSKAAQATTENSASHSQKLTPQLEEKLNAFRKKLAQSSDKIAKASWADSIAQVFKNVARFDSAAHYMAVLVDNLPNLENLRKAGDAYFEAYRFALSVDTAKSNFLGTKARTYYEKVLSEQPKDYKTKANLAMTYISQGQPMKPVMMLREILAEDADNQWARLYLGLLSMQSGQYPKAVDHFEKLIKAHPNHFEAKFYLAQSYLEQNKTAEATTLLKELTQLKGEAEAPFREAAQETLNQLKK